MDTYKVNPQVKKALQYNLFTTEDECESFIRKGSQAIFSSQYLEKITKITHGKATADVLDFIKSYIAQYDYVGVENLTLRYFSVMMEGEIEGVEIQVMPYDETLIVRKLSGLYGISGVDMKIREMNYA